MFLCYQCTGFQKAGPGNCSNTFELDTDTCTLTYKLSDCTLQIQHKGTDQAIKSLTYNGASDTLTMSVTSHFPAASGDLTFATSTPNTIQCPAAPANRPEDHKLGEGALIADLDRPEDLVAVEAADGPCCLNCTLPLVKYYSVDHGPGHSPFCGETCIDPKKFALYHFFEKNLTLGSEEHPCHDQYTQDGGRYAFYHSTVTHGVPGIFSVTLDLYSETA